MCWLCMMMLMMVYMCTGVGVEHMIRAEQLSSDTTTVNISQQL